MRDSTVHLGVVATSAEDSGDRVEIAVRTPEGDACGDDGSSSGYPVTASAFGARLTIPDGEAGDRDDPCLQAETLEITLSRGTSSYTGDLPVAIRVVEEAPLDSFADLPPVPSGATPIQYLDLIVSAYTARRRGLEELAVALFDDLDLLPLIDTPVMSMSRGQVYKVALAGLIAVSPDLWLCDEPFASGMDPQGLAVFRNTPKRRPAAAERCSTRRRFSN